MNEQLQEKLVEILSQIQQGVQQAGSFALEQLPDIAQQYVLWGRVSNIVTCSLLLILSLSCFYICFKACTKPWYGVYYGVERVSDSCWSVRWLSCSIGLIFFTIFIAEINLMVWLAPKVWLIKEIATLIK